MPLNFANVLCAFALSLISVGQLAAQQKAGTKIAGTDRVPERSIMESDTDKFGLSQIGQIAISVNDLERATSFYRDKLGMKYLFTANGMAFFDNGGIRLLLTRLEKASSGPTGFVVYFKVGDIHEAYRTLTARGVRFEEEPELAARTEKFDLWLACFKDPENNNLCLLSEVSPK